MTARVQISPSACDYMTNIERYDLKSWISFLQGDEKRKALSKRLLSLIAVPTRKRVEVNLYKINRHSKDGDNIIVPGKVLSEGKLDHKINIIALDYSVKALKVLKDANCKVMKLEEIGGLSRPRIIT